MVKMLVWDMDGTIADLYSVPRWLEYLREENPLPYQEAAPMENMEQLALILKMCQVAGIDVRIVTWLSKDASPKYKEATRNAKMEWLRNYGFPFNHFHGVSYGTTKANSVRKYLGTDDEAILIDDNSKVRKGWKLGRTIDPTETNVLETLWDILKEVVKDETD